MSEEIVVKGARENNLKNIDITIPKNKLVVITGLSGSGKSSLAFDTIFAEGQRRYVESLSSYARQFLGMVEKPDVDNITGLSPAISIDQKTTSRNPRSTVATVTEIYDYLRLLYARIGVPHCPVCGKEITQLTQQDIVNEILKLKMGMKALVLAPVVLAKKGEFQHIPEEFLKKGFARVRVDGVVYALDEFPLLEKQKKHTIEVVVDRLIINEENRNRISQSVEAALNLTSSLVSVLDSDTDEVHSFSKAFACLDHPEAGLKELEPRVFSFNSPQGACPECTGLGNRLEVDPELLMPNPRLSITEGAIRPLQRMGADAWTMKQILATCEAHGIDARKPVGELTEDEKKVILEGSDRKVKVSFGRGSYEVKFEGVAKNIRRRWQETDSENMRRELEKYMREQPCNTCHGKRLKPEVLAVKIDKYSIMDICEMDIEFAVDVFDKIKFSDKEQAIGRLVLKEIKSRLSFLNNVGLSYLNLARSAATLSGGEAQRIRLATQIGSGLEGVLYVLDEPSIGLHQRDNTKLLATLKHLKELGNTVIVVEHDEETIMEADYLVDVGPKAGVHGGEIVAAGTPKEVAKNKDSITGAYLAGREKIEANKKIRKGNGLSLEIIGAKENNLKDVSVKIPLGKMVVVSGVSGSGKSTLINDILAKELHAQLLRAQEPSGRHERIDGIENLDKIVIIDQSPIGRTPRSNPATYTGLFGPLRDLFTALPEAKVRGYKAGRFSFNVAGGRCETCQGDGVIKIEMHFLPDVYVPCEVCHGKRYKAEVLEVKFNGKSIADVLEMTVEDAVEFFKSQPAINKRLSMLNDVGLGYITLGQSATTLSGGEAQRVKLATELSKRPTGKTLYVLDEPTTGLHMHDVKKLLEVLNTLVDSGNSMVIIEHNLDVIKSADHIIDMGPEGGQKGGLVVAEGTPNDVSKVKGSYTGWYLQKNL
ncbi:MAG: excinuclease ABC subunit UvrA [Candidatus Nomurabacteria bacterium]|nr:MAG: excinuclease ABC subunit UvrA [Candidatus Nomurabacteria bacterium]HRV76113.1 excinuclease ABC subunit UvrA [Candidatus Saccharimonadales bacterium]